ncbi:putative Zinc metalloproteinase nas-14 [Hypsibius exemplaris]|uniref:Metalloendopeptidase n=1 Tax=Hypsibius exemplaris TaxID=2072580 RepID=A0A9X6NS67_HYPEX|nr:putative Zinc metalloproteinase nas-14 [Hypsibius exemplaris]
MIGRQNQGRQPLNLESGCWTKSTIQHELMHALGFFHEHARADRDEYIEIVSANIERGQENNFLSWDNKTITAFGLPYDFDSILHYPAIFLQRKMVASQLDPPSESEQNMQGKHLVFKLA